MSVVLGNNSYITKWVNVNIVDGGNKNNNTYSSFWTKDINNPIHYIYQGNMLFETYYSDMEDNQYCENEEIMNNKELEYESEYYSDSEISSDSEDDDFEII